MPNCVTSKAIRWHWLGLITAGIAFLWSPSVMAAPADLSLDGTWYFAPDPLKLGEENEWHLPPTDWEVHKAVRVKGWDKVTVPHCWNVDPRYQYVGLAWYQRSINVPPADVANAPKVYRLQFGAVFHRCKVWVNGVVAGQHEGGFTPFEFDVSKQLKPGQFNLITVAVDNSWTRQTLPGARVGTTPANQLYPWWPNGGITRPVRLVGHDDVYIASQIVEAEPDFADQIVRFSVSVEVYNKCQSQAEVQLEWTLADTDSPEQSQLGKQAQVSIPAGGRGTHVFTAQMPLDRAQLWGLDTPELYFSDVTLTRDSSSSRHRERFGIRSIRIDGTRLLLNDQPIKLAGANRAFDHPKYGTIDPPEMVLEDGRLLKQAGLELSRLQHQPLSKAMLDWADENGLLIIQEASAWGMRPEDQADPVIQKQYKAQLTETVNSSRNHPCVIGWSVGNEYFSWTPEGVAWTRMMKRFLREDLNEKRPVMFVALGRAGRLFLEHYETGTLDLSATSFTDSDILCINWYGSPDPLGPIFDVLHQHYPDRPMFISENGMRADKGTPEQRSERLRATLALIRKCDYVIGYSYWSFNDYRSMYPGTHPSGVRPWGLVEFDRTPRQLYHEIAVECAALVLEIVQRSDDQIRLRAWCRDDFPMLAVAGYAVELRDAQGRTLARESVKPLQPGEETEITLPLDTKEQPESICVVRPGGWLGMRLPLTED